MTSSQAAVSGHSSAAANARVHDRLRRDRIGARPGGGGGAPLESAAGMKAAAGNAPRPKSCLRVRLPSTAARPIFLRLPARPATHGRASAEHPVGARVGALHLAAHLAHNPCPSPSLTLTLSPAGTAQVASMLGSRYDKGGFLLPRGITIGHVSRHGG